MSGNDDFYVGSPQVPSYLTDERISTFLGNIERTRFFSHGITISASAPQSNTITIANNTPQNQSTTTATSNDTRKDTESDDESDDTYTQPSNEEDDQFFMEEDNQKISGDDSKATQDAHPDHLA